MLNQLKKQIQVREANLKLQRALISMYSEQASTSTRQILASPSTLMVALIAGFSWTHRRLNRNLTSAIKAKPYQSGWLSRLSALFTLNKILSRFNLSPFTNKQISASNPKFKS